MKETVEKTATGAILYDPSIVNQISDATFTPHSWQASEAVRGTLRSGGRGNTYVLDAGNQRYVLRHYRRGGLMARLNRDAYLWLGAERTRSFMEFRLLSRLMGLQLPVPVPVAARYRRAGMTYFADLITVYVPGIEPLSTRIRRAAGRDFWTGIGAGIARFHRAGVYHADLNAYNVQVDTQDDILILDFDRGSMKGGSGWQARNLARLERSLHKVQRLDPQVQFSSADWRQLLMGYSDACKSA